MSAAIDTVNRFIKAWEPDHGYRAAMTEFFTPDCVYENVGMTYSTGAAESIAVIDAMSKQTGFASLMVEMREIIASGNVVMTERTDHLYDASGRRLVSLRVMGVFEIRGGKIAGWRDYFDTAAFAPK